MEDGQLSPTRKRISISPKPEGDLSGGRVTLGSIVNAITKWENGQWITSFKVSDGAFRENSIWYTPDVTFRRGEGIVDENHGAIPYGRAGGPMRLVRVDMGVPVDPVFARGTYVNYNGLRRYEGGFMPPPETVWWGSSAWWGTQMDPDTTLLMANFGDLGYRAWKATKPNLQRADAFVFGREAKEIPSMFKTTLSAPGKVIGGLKNSALDFHRWFSQSEIARKGLYDHVRGFSKEVSNQYLNAVFGWAPFLRDMVNLHKVYHHGRVTILKLIEQNGKYVRRRVPLKSDETVENLGGGNYGGYSSTSYPIQCFPQSFPSEFFSGVPSWTRKRITTRVESAVGKWKFYRPEFDLSIADMSNAWRTAMQYLTISGLRPSPLNIYKSTPWTWLIDWFTGLGRYAEHINDILVDSVASEYCYAMCHQRQAEEFTNSLPFFSGHLDLKFTRFYESKERKGAASPYDFDQGWNGLSQQQLAILGALKISRS